MHINLKIEYASDVFYTNIQILSIIKDVLKRLMEYNFERLFSMNLDAISLDLSNGVYAKRLPPRKSKECTSMDAIVLEVLKDIELVWHNCLSYNREGKNHTATELNLWIYQFFLTIILACIDFDKH